jgi:hypothetical protein
MRPNLSALNPADYVATIGLFRIVADLDPSATLNWDRSAPDQPVITTKLADSLIAETLRALFKLEQYRMDVAWNPEAMGPVPSGRCERVRITDVDATIVDDFTPVRVRTKEGKHVKLESVMLAHRFIRPDRPPVELVRMTVPKLTRKEGESGKLAFSCWKRWAGASSLMDIIGALLVSVPGREVDLASMLAASSTDLGKKHFRFDARMMTENSTMNATLVDEMGYAGAVRPVVELLFLVGGAWWDVETTGANSSEGFSDDGLVFTYTTWFKPLRAPAAHLAVVADPEYSDPSLHQWSAFSISKNQSKTSFNYARQNRRTS